MGKKGEARVVFGWFKCCPQEDEGEEYKDEFATFVSTTNPNILPPAVTFGEVLLFEHRAKIYRHDFCLKEWKELGRGNIAILQDKNNNSTVRVIMWREKDGNLLCNHRITGNMRIDYHQQNNKAVRWSAIDHAEGELKPELFACRFGKEEKCKEFKNKFEEMVDLLATSPLRSTTIEEENSTPIKSSKVTEVDLDKSFGHATPLQSDFPIFNFGFSTLTPTNHLELPEKCPDAWDAFDAARVCY